MSNETGHAPPKAWHYADGRWSEGPDPVTEAWGQEDAIEVLTRLGYKILFDVGDSMRGGFTVWKRSVPPRHVIEAYEGELGEFFYVDAAPDIRDVCARWGPLARDSAILKFITDLTKNEFHLRGGGDDDISGVIETIARRAARGVGQAGIDPEDIVATIVETMGRRAARDIDPGDYR